MTKSPEQQQKTHFFTKRLGPGVEEEWLTQVWKCQPVGHCPSSQWVMGEAVGEGQREEREGAFSPREKTDFRKCKR